MLELNVTHASSAADAGTGWGTNTSSSSTFSLSFYTQTIAFLEISNRIRSHRMSVSSCPGTKTVPRPFQRGDIEEMKECAWHDSSQKGPKKNFDGCSLLIVRNARNVRSWKQDPKKDKVVSRSSARRIRIRFINDVSGRNTTVPYAVISLKVFEHTSKACFKRSYEIQPTIF